jgi:hypothetical protein
VSRAAAEKPAGTSLPQRFPVPHFLAERDRQVAPSVQELETILNSREKLAAKVATLSQLMRAKDADLPNVDMLSRWDLRASSAAELQKFIRYKIALIKEGGSPFENQLVAAAHRLIHEELLRAFGDRQESARALLDREPAALAR